MGEAVGPIDESWPGVQTATINEAGDTLAVARGEMLAVVRGGGAREFARAFLSAVGE